MNTTQAKDTTSRNKSKPVSPRIETMENHTIPIWVKDNPDRHSFRRHPYWGHWYNTPEDLLSGMNLTEESQRIRKTYVIRHYILPENEGITVMRIDGKAWCLLVDIEKISGQGPEVITGIDAEDGYYGIHVRGAPGFLIPDGIILDDDYFGGAPFIRLEAGLRFLEKMSVDRQITDSIRRIVIPDIYSNHRTGIQDQGDTSVLDVRYKEFEKPLEGEIRGVRIGLKFWIRVDDVSNLTGIGSETIIQIAGGKGTVVMVNRDVSTEADGSDVYVDSRCVDRLLLAMGKCAIAKKLRNWISGEILSAPNLAKAGACVSASRLKKMLGNHIPFRELAGMFMPEVPDGDFSMPIDIAYKIARKNACIKALIACLLLADSGFLHGGSIDETPDETLERFQGLVPDVNGFVDAGKVHEFMGKPVAFPEWSEWHATGQGMYMNTSDNVRIYEQTAWRCFFEQLWNHEMEASDRI